jgi:hypothetical protein
VANIIETNATRRGYGKFDTVMKNDTVSEKQGYGCAK